MLLAGDPHDEALRAQVRPQDWTPPRAADRYHLVVLGGGTAGLVAAVGAAGLGARVALVERQLLGGDCLNFGCVPSKALLRSAHAAAALRDAAALGLRAGPPEVDFPAVMARLRRLRAGLARHDAAARLRDAGVDVFLGHGRFTGRDRLVVDGRELRFRRALVATGGRPAVPELPGLAEAGYRTNLDIFALTRLPRRLVVIGGGPIGCEMAQAFAALGSTVTLLTRGPRLLPRDDPEAAGLLAGCFRAEGIRVETGATPFQVAALQGGGKRVWWRRDGREEAADADEILVAAGRRPNVEDLGLEAAGVAAGHRGIQVDARLRTTNPRIYAAGDAAGLWQFTHAADAMARMVLRNAFFFGRRRWRDLVVPWCTYTRPEVAQVGLRAGQEEEAGTALEELRLDLEEVDRFVLEEEAAGFAKLVVERRSGRLLGATLVGAHAGELLGELCRAVTERRPATELAAVIRPYPTRSQVWGRLGDRALRRRLTPGVARLLRLFLALAR